MKNQTTLAAVPATAKKRRAATVEVTVGNDITAANKNAAASIIAKPSIVTAKAQGGAVAVTGASLLANLLSLREQGTAYYNNYFVPGRNAMQALMGEIYAQYHAAKSADTFSATMAVLREKLKGFGVKVRATSSDASIFIRLVFKDFDDKQVSIYSRSLVVAFDDGIAPEAFGKFVDDTEGGFYGIVISTATGKPTQEDGGSNAGKAALYDVKAERTVNTIDDFMWDDDEEHCVLVAIRGTDDDSATLKKIGVSEKLLLSFLANYAAEKKAALKKVVSSDVDATKAAKKTFEADRANIETEIGNLQADLSAAKNSGAVAEVKRLIGKLKTATMRLDATNGMLKALKNEIEAEKEKAAA